MKYFVTAGAQEFEVVVDGETVTVDGQRHVARLTQLGDTSQRLLLLDDRPVSFPMEHESRGRWVVTSGGSRIEVAVEDERSRHVRSLLGSTGAPAATGTVRAPMPGMVVRILVAEGDEVAQGQGLLVLEAMKMENEIRAAAAGKVGALVVKPGTAVEKGQALVEVV